MYTLATSIQLYQIAVEMENRKNVTFWSLTEQTQFEIVLSLVPWTMNMKIKT